MTPELKTQASAYNQGYARGYQSGLQTALRVIKQILADAAAASEKPVLVAPLQPQELDKTILESALAELTLEDNDPRR